MWLLVVNATDPIRKQSDNAENVELQLERAQGLHGSNSRESIINFGINWVGSVLTIVTFSSPVAHMK